LKEKKTSERNTGLGNNTKKRKKNQTKGTYNRPKEGGLY